MTRLSFIYLISFLLLIISFQLNQKQKSSIKIPLKNSYLHKDATAFSHAIATGDKSKLSRKLKESFKTLNLLHLFTPSGLHFSALFLFLFPLLKTVKKKSTAFYLLTVFSICAFPFSLAGLYSLKRIALLKIIHSTTKSLGLKVESFYLFLATFVLDFIRGSYFNSPLSYSYSFLFLGIIFTIKNPSFLKLSLLLFSGQIIISYFQNDSFSLIGFFPGAVLTIIFSILFPIFFIHYWLGTSLLQEQVSYLLSTFISFVLTNADLAMSLGVGHSSLFLLIMIFLFSLKNKKWLWPTPFLLLFHSSPIYSFPKSAIGKTPESGIDASWLSRYDSIKRTRRGFKLTYGNGYTCYNYLNDYFYDRNCKLTEDTK